METRIISILDQLVACDTQNPPRQIGPDHAVFGVLREHLNGFDQQVTDYGKGRVSLLARRGQPNRLFNVHLDTVPVGQGWTKPPLQLSVVGEQVFGRGVCDNKGAAACLLAMAEASDGELAMLFTTDEEGTESCCVNEFCQTDALGDYDLVLVAEPTRCRPVTAHRGYLSVSGSFRGQAGHTSRHELLRNSANHRALIWAGHALKTVSEIERGLLGGQSSCFNIGRIDGGTKNNVVAESCELSWSARLPPGLSSDSFLEQLSIADSDQVSWRVSFAGSSLPVEPGQRQTVEAWIRDLNLESAVCVDFWTEAAIFSRHGKPALVIGPGDIRQAHTADEWTTVPQLRGAFEIYQQLAQRPCFPKNNR